MKKRAWLFLIPTLVLVSINAFIPLMTVINYSLHYIFSGSKPLFVGLQNYQDVMRDSMFHASLWRQIIFSLMVLVVEIPLGVGIALCMPKKGIGVAFTLVLLGIPLLIPFNVVGIIWKLFTQNNIGLIPKIFEFFNYSYNVNLSPIDAPLTIFASDVWHWTPLVALLSYAGLNAIPNAFYQAAKIDGAGRLKTFRYVTLPQISNVLIIGVLLRFMDSFKIYDEPLMLTGGGPGVSTMYLNLFVARKAESYDLGYAGAVSIIYLLIVMIISYLFFQIMTRISSGGAENDSE